MGLGAVLEPAIVVFLLFGGTWLNRAQNSHPLYSSANAFSNWRDSTSSEESEDYRQSDNERDVENIKSYFSKQVRERTAESPDLSDDASGSQLFDHEDEVERAVSTSLLPHPVPRWRTREVRVMGWKKRMTTPNTEQFKDRLLSRLLARFPFLVEAWYWALVYWTYQVGRAFTALTLQESTVNVARKHALQVIKVEQALKIFLEPTVQGAILARPGLLKWINWLYSFIHIPGTIAFLVWLYYYTTTCNRAERDARGTSFSGTPGGPALYQARRRALAFCNLVAFIVFTLWPCMPPRLLSDEDVGGAVGELARSYGFVDTVHGIDGASSVWTQNRFCNQYAAMPSLHFGYSFLIGLTIMTIPLSSKSRSKALYIPLRRRSSSEPGSPSPKAPFKVCLPSWQRMICIIIGVLYPSAILLAIVSTANHFILDAVAGAAVCIFSLYCNKILLNFLWLEDWFLWCVRIHKPDPEVDGRIQRHLQRAMAN